MSREEPRQHVTPRDSYSGVLDFAADIGFDAVEFGQMDPRVVASALEAAADEIKEDGHMYTNAIDQQKPEKSEAADFGGGESTGVQDL